jgi:hypothetical protein
MIKLVYCINRKKGMSQEDFHHYWANVHGPIGASIPGAGSKTLCSMRYVPP